jgi:lipid-binding SYLF domain-containing protein
MMKRAFRGIVLALVTAGLALAGSARAADPEKKTADAQKLVVDAGATFDEFWKDRDLEWLRKHKADAKGFLIAPEIVKAGFVFGGSGGRAVLVAKGPKGWEGPAFYSMGTASVGFQAGVSVMTVVAVVMTQKGLDSLMSSSLKFGADASVAAGPVGVGTGVSGIKADFVIYSKAKGLYGGANFEGAVVKPSEDFNKAYYSQDCTPIDIIVKGSVPHNKAADSPLFWRIAK